MLAKKAMTSCMPKDGGELCWESVGLVGIIIMVMVLETVIIIVLVVVMYIITTIVTNGLLT